MPIFSPDIFDSIGDAIVTGGTGVSTFVALNDTPSSYSGESLKFVRVNVGETALEFTTHSSKQDMFIKYGFSDTSIRDVYLPVLNQSESASPNYWTKIIAPFTGSLTNLSFQVGVSQTAGDFSFTLYKVTSGTSGTLSSLENISVTGAKTDFVTYNAVFSSNTFNVGDALVVKFHNNHSSAVSSIWGTIRLEET